MLLNIGANLFRRKFFFEKVTLLSKVTSTPQKSDEEKVEKRKVSRNPAERAFSAKENVVDWKIVQSKKGRSQLQPIQDSINRKTEETDTQSHLEKSSIWKKRGRLPPSDVLTLVAEEQIAEAAQRGFFDNLKGAGKPLTPDDLLPPGKGDITERLINRMINRQGFIPEWIESEKDIAGDIKKLRQQLIDKFSAKISECHNEMSLIDDETRVTLNLAIKDINSQIDRLNLIVPMLRFQRAHVNLEREMKRLKAAVISKS